MPLLPLQNCNVLLEDATGATVFNFQNAGRGTTPCSLQMLNSGQMAIVDSQGVQWNLNTKPAVPTTAGTMLVGQTLLQARTSCCMRCPLFAPALHSWRPKVFIHTSFCYQSGGKPVLDRPTSIPDNDIVWGPHTHQRSRIQRHRRVSSGPGLAVRDQQHCRPLLAGHAGGDTPPLSLHAPIDMCPY